MCRTQGAALDFQHLAMKRFGLGVTALIRIDIGEGGACRKRARVLGAEGLALTFDYFFHNRFRLLELALASVELAEEIQTSEGQGIGGPKSTAGDIGKRRQDG